MNSNKTYFLVPGWDFPVGSIVLGSVIASPTQPASSLYTPAGGSIDTPIYPTTKARFTGEVAADKKGKVGLFCRFLDLFSIGAEAAFRYDSKSVLTYSFHELKTEWFVPSDDLKKKATKDAKVVSFCRNNDYESLRCQAT